MKLPKFLKKKPPVIETEPQKPQTAYERHLEIMARLKAEKTITLRSK